VHTGCIITTSSIRIVRNYVIVIIIIITILISVIVVFVQFPLRPSVLSGELTHIIPKSSNEHLFRGISIIIIMWFVSIASYNNIGKPISTIISRIGIETSLLPLPATGKPQVNRPYQATVVFGPRSARPRPRTQWYTMLILIHLFYQYY